MTGLTLPGHDRRALLELGQEDLRQAGARAGAEEAQVVRDLRQADRERLQRAGGLDEAVAGGLRLERVGRRGDRQGRCRPRAARARARRTPDACSGRCRRRCRRAGSCRAARASPRRAPCPRAPARRSRRTPGRASPGTASIQCVRPDLTTSSNSVAFASSAAASWSSAGSRSWTISSSAARCTADGKTSFEHWPMLTSSFACTPSPASVAITSFAFMFDEVPEPVWKTSIGNWSSSSPSATRSAGGGDPLRLVLVEQAELGVHARRGGLDPAEPARHRRRDRLAGDGEVGDRLAGLAAPQLRGWQRCRSQREVSSRRRCAAGSSSSQARRASRAGGRAARRRARSAASIACQPA